MSTYRAVTIGCDGCEVEGDAAFVTAAEVRAWARANGWRRVYDRRIRMHRDLCPECYAIDEIRGARATAR